MKHLCYITVACLFILGCDRQKQSKADLPPNYMVSKVLRTEAVNTSWHALVEGQALANTGGSFKEILELLPDSAQVMMNKTSLMFFVEGSVPMMITKPLQSDKITKGVAGKIQPTLLANATVRPLFEMDNTNVIAHELGEENRQYKKALVIYPYIQQFGINEDAQPAVNYLGSHHNYRDGIKSEEIADDLALFKTWNNYDLVHVSTHGLLFCGESALLSNIMPLDEFDYDTFEINDEETEQVEDYNPSGYDFTEEEAEKEYNDTNCKTILETGIEHHFKEKTKEERMAYFDKLRIDAQFIVLTEDGVGLKANFFQHYYPQVEDKIWIFSACEMGQHSDMQETMRSIHKNGHFLYWQNVVYSNHAINAFNKFYKNLVVEGLDAQKAHENIPVKLRTNLKSWYIINKDTVETTTELLHLQTGEPRHAIEVVQLLHPVKETVLRSGDNYPLDGDFGDGQPETLVVKMDLLGYTRSEFEERGMTLTLKVDDHTVLNRFAFLPDDPDDAINIKKIPGKEYGLRLHFEGLEIPDLPADKETLELKAYLHFNGTDYSIHSEVVNVNPRDVRVTGSGPYGGMTITYDADTGASKYEAPDIPGGHTFSDELGYMYVNNPRQGWQKLNLNKFKDLGMANLGAQTQKMPYYMGTLFGKNPDSFQIPDVAKGDVMIKPIVNWPERMTIAALSQNPEFKKQEIACLSAKGDCVRFTGVSGDATGVQIYFNVSGKLQRINMKGHQLDYEYGDYTVILPQAQELKFPF